MDADAVDPSESSQSESDDVTNVEKTGPLQVSVTEKVIFCIDSLVVFNCVANANELILQMHELIRTYMSMKRKINFRPVEFQCLIFGGNGGRVSEVALNQGDDLHSAFVSFAESESGEETKAFDFNAFFTTLAKRVQLPNPKTCAELPPPYVYHCILFFGRNVYLPVMEETNAFDFLMQNPFFAFDTLYMYDNDRDDNNCDVIASVLLCLYEKEKGYFVSAHKNDTDRLFNVFMQLLGHPLMRKPQSQSKFSIKELQCEDKE